MIDINLLPPQNVLTMREKKIRNTLLLCVVGLSLISGILWTGVLTVRGLVFARVNSLEKTRQDFLQAYKEESSKVSALTAISDKALAIGSIRNPQTTFSVLIKDYLATLPAGITFTSVGFSPDGKVNFVGTANSLKSLDNLVAAISDNAQDKKFHSAVMSGLREGEDGSFSFSVNFTYVK